VIERKRRVADGLLKVEECATMARL
jgi:hypothetical protein